MGEADLPLLALMIAVAGLGMLSRRVGTPYPILLVLGGLILGYVPGMPTLPLPPEQVLLLFLPPLLYAAGFGSSPRELRTEAHGIVRLAVGLTLATMVAVAATARAVVGGMSWPVALTLGAIVAPTDPLAATVIARRLGVDRRVITLIEGEGLTNDATALVAYRITVAAALGASVTAGGVAVQFLLGIAGGVAVGLAVGWLATRIRRLVSDPLVETTMALVTAYAAYLPAQALGVSGVLAAVTAGLYVGWQAPTIVSASTRLVGTAFWDVLVYLLNAVLFILIGLQLHPILTQVSGRPPSHLLAVTLLISLVVIGVRIGWHFTVPYLIDVFDRRGGRPGRRPSAKQLLVVAWSGMRGAVSLTVALALPTGTATTGPFPDRDLILFVTFGVVFITLVLPGLTLPALIRLLRVRDTGAEAREEARARLAATEAALARLAELAAQDWVGEDTVERLERVFHLRRRRLRAQAGLAHDEETAEHSRAYRRLIGELIDAQRDALISMRDRGEIGSGTLHRIERDLDLEESRLEV
ncbi:Na+/H+ antiporter [Planosporangium sp. 12N6]|uniref:Na+/H+ antiporter n=1 Tax=Planosporangium spinosum TaxID=3402278 RepID=UPI003CE87E22